MSSKRSNLFGGRPDLLLVDERPPGISLPELSAAPLPELEDEPEEPSVTFYDDDDDDDVEDDDSYDGDGPLRIFIGSPRAEAAAEADEDAAPPPVLKVESGPVWDASALALGADDDLEDGGEDTELDRSPVLVKPGGTIEPPPLTMSFGGSFSRGSLDAGVMDEETAGDIDSVEPARADTVVVHDQIYDRFLRFEDPTEPPPASDAPLAAGPSDDHITLAAGEAEEDEAIAVGQVPDDVEPGPPPTRLSLGHADDDDDDDEYDEYDSGLASLGGALIDEDEPLGASVSLGRPGAETVIGAGSDVAPEPPEVALPSHHDEDDDDEDSGLQSLGPSLADDEDELTSPVTPRVIISDTLPGLSGLGGKNLAQNEDDTEERPVVPPPTELPRTAPEWAVRRRVARDGAVREGTDDASASEGSGMGLLIFVVVAIVAVLAAWWFLGRGGSADLSLGSDEDPTEQTTPTSTTPTPAAGTRGDAVAPSDAPTDEAPADATPAALPTGADAAPDAGVIEFVPEGSTAGSTDPADLGILRVRATRPSRVYVDGQLVGETPMSAISVPSGEHSVKVVAIDSGRARSQSVRVDAGRAQEVRFTF